MDVFIAYFDFSKISFFGPRRSKKIDTIFMRGVTTLPQGGTLGMAFAVSAIRQRTPPSLFILALPSRQTAGRGGGVLDFRISNSAEKVGKIMQNNVFSKKFARLRRGKRYGILAFTRTIDV